MAFGGNIRALLDTYANCISLLKGFGRRRDNNDSNGSRHEHSRLRKALKSDRSLVKRAYSSKLSESGNRLRKGDARAIRALDRILKRLRNAIAGLLRLSSRKDGLDLDYESLVSLSNASRHDTIKTIDSLSRRLRSASRSSADSSSSAKTSPKASSSRHKTRSSSSTGSSVSASKGRKEGRKDDAARKKLPAAAKERKSTSKGHNADVERLRKPNPPVSSLAPELPNTQHRARPSRAMSLGPKSPRIAKLAEPNRISIMSFSSDSTKLGEIPQRKWQPATQYTTPDTDAAGYTWTPVYPLKPHVVEVKERRIFAWFGRKREA